MRIPFWPKIKYSITDIAPVDFNDEDGRQLILERRRILLPIIKKIWREEARALEKQYATIMVTSMGFNLSIERRISDYEYQLREIARSKSSAFTEKATLEIRAKLDELNFIKSELEKERLKK